MRCLGCSDRAAGGFLVFRDPFGYDPTAERSFPGVPCVQEQRQTMKDVEEETVQHR